MWPRALYELLTWKVVPFAGPGQFPGAGSPNLICLDQRPGATTTLSLPIIRVWLNNQARSNRPHHVMAITAAALGCSHALLAFKLAECARQRKPGHRPTASVHESSFLRAEVSWRLCPARRVTLVHCTSLQVPAHGAVALW
jgi:hypothetical protein